MLPNCTMIAASLMRRHECQNLARAPDTERLQENNANSARTSLSNAADSDKGTLISALEGHAGGKRQTQS